MYPCVGRYEYLGVCLGGMSVCGGCISHVRLGEYIAVCGGGVFWGLSMCGVCVPVPLSVYVSLCGSE